MHAPVVWRWWCAETFLWSCFLRSLSQFVYFEFNHLKVFPCSLLQSLSINESRSSRGSSIQSFVFEYFKLTSLPRRLGYRVKMRSIRDSKSKVLTSSANRNIFTHFSFGPFTLNSYLSIFERNLFFQLIRMHCWSEHARLGRNSWNSSKKVGGAVKWKFGPIPQFGDIRSKLK